MMFLFLLAFISSLFSFVSALPASSAQFDVWAPPIIYPNSNTVWVAGDTYTVTWNTSSKPSQVTNSQGMIYLRIGNTTQASPIAQGFPLSAGQVNVTVPANTQPSTNWIVVLMGDSGDWSEPFTILASS